MQNGSIKSIPLSAVRPETLANWFSWAGQENEKPLVADMYTNVPWLYRGVNAICNAVVSMPHSLHKGSEDGEEVDPNTLDFATHIDDLLDIFTGHLLFYGACYGIVERNKFGIARDFRPYDPKTITPMYDAEQGFTGVKRSVNGKEYKVTVDDGLFYTWIPNRTGELGAGVSDVQAALAAAGVLRNIDIYADMYFKNGAVNPTLISVEGGSTLPADVERLKAWYKRMLSGVRKAFGIEMINGKISAQTIGYALKDLATTELTSSKREDVSTALGIPQTLLFSNAANYATAQQDDLHFYDKTVKPKAIRLQNALNKQVYEKMGYYLKFHPERMEMYQQQEEQKSASVVSLYQAGIMTLDEVREHMNLAPLISANVSNDTPTNIAGVNSKSALPEIFGYHLENGVVSKNETRERLGLAPIDDKQGDELRKLQSQMVVLQSIVNTGIPLSDALPLVGLKPLSMSTDNGQQSDSNRTDAAPTVEDKTKNAVPLMKTTHVHEHVENAATVELEKWQTVALKRLKENRFAKALEFTSTVLRPSMVEAIKGNLENVTDATEIKRVFSNALEWAAYP